jgi:3-phosphoshikimate 1-carboxyvinyltransferase
LLLRPISRLHGSFRVPGDKSISHRALLLASIADGASELLNVGPGADVAATAGCLRHLGVSIEHHDTTYAVSGRGLRGWRPPGQPLDCENSGTAMRLLAGLLAGQGLTALLTGDPSLSLRPMRRIVEPLRAMGAQITARERELEAFPPLETRGGRLHGIDYLVSPPSAQVKSCLLLAGLYAAAPTVVREARPTRDHTERMLLRMGASLECAPGSVKVEPAEGLRPLGQFRCPGDPSSAAFLIGAAAAREGSEVQVEDVSLNPTRLGFLRALERMGASLKVVARGGAAGADEPSGTVSVRGGPLRALEVLPEEIPDLIDELPMLAVLATRATGRTQIAGARELRVKESDRIRAMARGLNALGARVTELPDGWIIEGGAELRGAPVDAAGDHRVAMALAVAAGLAQGITDLKGAEWVDVSFPGFFEAMDRLQGNADG